MLINLPRGQTWNRTLEVWQRAMKVVVEQIGKPLAFCLRVLPLSEFLTHPDWEANASIYWGEVKIEEAKSAPEEKSLSVKLPEGLRYRTRREEQIVLSALLDYFLKDASRMPGEYPRADPEFLNLMRLIHSASFDPSLPVRQRAGLPHASLYLLNQYFKMHRDLLEKLNSTLHYAPGSMRWNPTTILHRMQVVINVVLRYHGWRSDGDLYAAPIISAWDEEQARTFSVTVHIRNAEVMMAEEEIVVPNQSEVRDTERALAWGLRALFEYSLDLGLGRVEFW